MQALSRVWNWTSAAICVMSGMLVVVFMALIVLVFVSALEALMFRDRVRFYLWAAFGGLLILIAVIGIACVSH